MIDLRVGDALAPLESIGFYTLSDDRAKRASKSSPLWRCELLLTGRCNFRCPYCRSVGGRDLSLDRAMRTVDLWADMGLKNVRFSGGEPTLYAGLGRLISVARSRGIERIAISTNGSAPLDVYRQLLALGANDFSVSLDACCAADGDRMAGGREGAFARVVDTISMLVDESAYITVGVVLTMDNQQSAERIIAFAAGLGVSDIRVIPAAQEGHRLPALNVDRATLERFPILLYRVEGLACGKAVRGIPKDGAERCGLVLDDMAVMGDKHYPCIIYLREGGPPIGSVGPRMREERGDWYEKHNNFTDPICSANCLDVCCDYNHKHATFARCSTKRR
jgi:pyruvate-formate lyase-activating enzyme